ncbi:hypothetical protein Pcinc_026387 [Petrolisthes cinctipes]|uniref:Uncharacterized protein n=1 Tax=Petrolisthes cinctipes TaxID=88211 RepID=A0AAE1F663_PETCI|nr:hypothetical protein Pcinc_026387 [Petrolisthes cinctipes]
MYPISFSALFKQASVHVAPGIYVLVRGLLEHSPQSHSQSVSRSLVRHKRRKNSPEKREKRRGKPEKRREKESKRKDWS